ncbi:MAG: pitrilysin family protein [Patescibacteria group bacterium]
MHKKIQRKDGSVIVLVPHIESKSVTWEIMYKVGSRQETKKINGVSHFIEHLMFKGTKKRHTTKVLSQQLDAVGAEYNAFTTKDHTGYYITTAAAHAELGIDILSDMLLNSTFEKKEMDRERGVIIEELNMRRDNAMIRIDEIFEMVMLRGSSMAWDVGGPHQVIRAIPHEDLIAFKNKYYYPGNMVIGVAGGFDERKVLRLINRYLPVKSFKKKAEIRPVKLTQEAPRIAVEYKHTDQAHLMVGFPGYPHLHRNLDPLILLSTIMGGTMSSRLFLSIREKRGLAYDIRSTTESFEDIGYFVVQGGFDKGRIYEGLEAVRFELDRVKKNGITHSELKMVKDNIRGRLTLRFEKPSTYLSYLLSQEIFTDRMYRLEERLDQLSRVTRDDVNRVARSVIDWKKSNLALIGPYKNKQKFLRVLTERSR